VAFAVEGDGVGFATESYAASALYTTLASLSCALWRIRRVRLDAAADVRQYWKSFFWRIVQKNELRQPISHGRALFRAGSNWR
jgi:hypothetical protein